MINLKNIQREIKEIEEENLKISQQIIELEDIITELENSLAAAIGHQHNNSDLVEIKLKDGKGREKNLLWDPLIFKMSGDHIYYYPDIF